MPGPPLTILIVLLSSLLVVPLALFLAVTHAGPLVAAGVAVLAGLALTVAIVTVQSVRHGRM